MRPTTANFQVQIGMLQQFMKEKRNSNAAFASWSFKKELNFEVGRDYHHLLNEFTYLKNLI